MDTNAAQFEERKLDRAGHDLSLLWRLYPFISPYRMLLVFSIVMAMAITALDLSLPYITKITIDRYIVPKTEAAGRDSAQSRILSVNTSDPEVAAVVRRYPALFTVSGTVVGIDYDRLKKLPARDLAMLRHHDLSGVTRMALIFLGAIIFDFILNFFQQMLMEITGQRIMHDLRMKLFTHIQALPIRFFNQTPVARLVTRTTNDVQNMQEMFTSVITFVFKDLLLLAGIAAMLLHMNWRLALMAFVVLPAVGYFSVHYSRLAREAFRVIRVKTAEINAHFSETITGMKVVQLFRQEDNNSRKFQKLNHEYYLAGMRQLHVFAIFMPVVELLGITALAIVIYEGGARMLAGHITIGVLAAFIAYIRMFFQPIRDIAEKYNILQNAMSSAERLFQILSNSEKDAPLWLPNAILPAPAVNAMDHVDTIAVDNVSFSYNPGEPVLRNVSFQLKSGETLAVVGPTGSGKTTLIHLLTRFYDPDSGRIRINGADIRNIPPGRLRSRLALVTQDPFIFSETVRENILHGGVPVSDAEMTAILESANCTDTVAKLPQGVDTLLSEGGASISSGERQLISIARAFARKPELIILDEATSYIDSGTEQKIQSALMNLTAGRTAIIIAHRLSTARLADMILVMKKGRIIESGTHEALMSRRGFYFRLNQMEKSAERHPAPDTRPEKMP